jgi:hypothetical protein
MMKFLKKVGTPNLDFLNVNKRADYSSYNTAVDLLTALSQGSHYFEIRGRSDFSFRC